MSWAEPVLDALQANPIGGYHAGQIPATEPTALAALALFAHDRLDAAKKAADWLATCQAMNGAVGVRRDEPEPRWPTALAVMVWAALNSVDTTEDKKFLGNQLYGTHWLFTFFGRPEKRNENMGHDTTIVAWPWVEGTHSWIEPTAYCVLAAKAVGEGAQQRTRDGVRCLIDRQLSTGGCNYGNTLVLGQELRAHVQPSGLALLALAGESDPAGRIDKSLAYLEREIDDATTAASLSFGLLGLAAHKRPLTQADKLLEAAYQRISRRGASTYKQALLCLAALGAKSPLITLPASAVPNTPKKKLAI